MLSKNMEQHTHAHRVCENAVVTLTRWGCNRGDYKLVIRESPDSLTFGGCVPSCRKSPDKHTHTHTNIPHTHTHKLNQIMRHYMLHLLNIPYREQ